MKIVNSINYHFETSFMSSFCTRIHNISKLCKHFLFSEYSSWGTHECASSNRRRPQPAFLIIEVKFISVKELLEESVRYRLWNQLNLGRVGLWRRRRWRDFRVWHWLKIRTEQEDNDILELGRQGFYLQRENVRD